MIEDEKVNKARVATKWSQRMDHVVLVFERTSNSFSSSVGNPVLSDDAGSVFITCEGGRKIEIPLYPGPGAATSVHVVSSFPSTVVKIVKTSPGNWPVLLSSPAPELMIGIDWDRWEDEDDDEDDEDDDFNIPMDEEDEADDEFIEEEEEEEDEEEEDDEQYKDDEEDEEKDDDDESDK
jgi:hypothetical protein